MKKKDFAALMEALDQMKRHMRGEYVPGLRITEVKKVRGKLMRREMKQRPAT
ncbi:MAG: hypothetical protein ACRCV9_14730 [Burkholderiaceae bacterium]